MGINLTLPTWTEAVGHAAQHRSSRGRECVALHRHDGVPVADDAQGFLTVQSYFYEWQAKGFGGRLNHHLVMEARKLEGREASPSARLIDSQSVKTTESGEILDYDAGKKIKGRNAISSSTRSD